MIEHFDIQATYPLFVVLPFNPMTWMTLLTSRLEVSLNQGVTVREEQGFSTILTG